MAYGIIWSEDAISDIENIAEFIAKDSVVYAKSVVGKLYSASQKLANNPKLGRVVPELYDTSIREIFIYSYRLLYRIENNQIQVGAVIHGYRNLESAIANHQLGC